MTGRAGVDMGGTFTDVVHYDEDRQTLQRTKILTSLERPGEALRDAAKQLGFEPDALSLFFHGTTLVTNLILERRGAKVGLITTAGFRDVLEIGLSYRPEPYNFQWDKTPPLVPRPLRREVEERISSEGEILSPLDEEQVAREAKFLSEQGVEVIAVSLLHSYANPEHERRAKKLIEAGLPEMLVSISSEVDPQLREYERCSTAVLNAYALPATANYVSRLEEDFKTPPDATFYMHSGGGVVPPSRARTRPIELVASGPSAGVLGASFLGQQIGLSDLITFDVGGTSSDVCVIEDGQVQMRDSMEIEWGIPLRKRSVDVISVGAGGGSIAWIDPGAALRVGPQSSGADPGPACYGAGGTDPTVTDANLVLGLLDSDSFLGGRMRLDVAAARDAMQPLAESFDIDVEHVADGIHRIAVTSMAHAIRTVTVQKGIDPRHFVLVAFGGAGGQHGAEVARELGISRVLFPALASTFSAFGLLTADLQATEQMAFFHGLEADMLESEEVFLELRARAQAALGETTRPEEFREERFCHLRYVGQTHELTIPMAPEGWRAMAARFEDTHERLYGTRLGDPIEVVSLGVTAFRELPKVPLPEWQAEEGPQVLDDVDVYGIDRPVVRYVRKSLPESYRVTGPCLVLEEDSTIFLRDGWHGTVGSRGELLCTFE